jgi:hypothetical protein
MSGRVVSWLNQLRKRIMPKLKFSWRGGSYVGSGDITAVKRRKKKERKSAGPVYGLE